MDMNRLAAYKDNQRDAKLLGIEIERMETGCADFPAGLPQALKAKRAELQELQFELRSIAAWLDSLTLIECFVVRMHLIEKLTWRLVLHFYIKEFGEQPCKSTLIRIQQNALTK